MRFEKKYFKDSKISNYKDYTKKKYAQLAKDIFESFKFKPQDFIVDFGCATGRLIYELKKLGLKKLKGTDVSYWAIEYGKQKLGLEKELDYFNLNLLVKPKKALLMLDVLEHVPTVEEINRILRLAKKSELVIVRVPVALKEGQHFYLKVSRNDKTHVQCHEKNWWIKLFRKNGYKLLSELKLKSIYSSKGVFAGVFVPKTK